MGHREWGHKEWAIGNGSWGIGYWGRGNQPLVMVYQSWGIGLWLWITVTPSLSLSSISHCFPFALHPSTHPHSLGWIK
jgi:hypothetical protein